MAIELPSSDIGASSPRAAPAWRLSFTSRVGKVSVNERILFTERLSLLLETGVALHNALQSLQQQSERGAMKALIQDLMDQVLQGNRFSEALARHPQVFSGSYVNLVAASEGGGFLPEVLGQLVEMDEKQERLRSAVIAAVTYPAALAFFSVAVVVFILVVVFPKFATLFSSIQNQLPPTTVFLMGLSNLLLNRTALVLSVIGGAIAVLLLLLSQPSVREWMDRMKLRVPFLRGLYIRIYLTRLLRVMGISLQHGVTVLATLSACREVISNREFQKFMARLEQQVTEGKGIAAGFLDIPYIPVTVQQMIATGEQTGSLAQVMRRVADYYDRELSRYLAQVSKLAEPVMLLVMGAMVGVIVSSLILPIFRLSRAVH